MRFDKIKKYFQKGINITGVNMGTHENVVLKNLSEAQHGIIYSDEEIEIVKKLENYTFDVYERAYNGSEEETTVKPMEIKDGKVVLKDGQITHRCSADMETLTNIAVGGVLASEWFGYPESAREGCLCVFLNRKFTSNNKQTNRAIEASLKPNQKCCFVYFDETNPIMQELVSEEYFEYERLKKEDPESIPKIYSQEKIELYEKIICPISGSGKNMHNSPEQTTYGWLAIPAGIPPQLINGICIHSQYHKELIENIEDLRVMYPNATIFDENQNVLALPLNQERAKQEEPNMI